MLHARDYLTTFRRLFLAHAPPYQAWMQPPAAQAKYLKKFHSISDVELAAHLAGRVTIAAPLIGADGTAQACALDVDAGGADALLAVLAAATGRELVAMAFTSSSTRHNGGHVWLLFDGPAPPAQLRQLAGELAAAAGLAAETYPSGKTLRLPLGRHRESRRRGKLLLADGTTLDLDADDDAIGRALDLLAQVPRNRCADLPAVPVGAAIRTAQTRQDGPGAPNTTISAYNAATDLLSLLVACGGRIAEQYRSGRTLVHCPCGQHHNGDAHASLEIQRARNPRYGQFVAVGYAPACAFSLERRVVVDAFAVYCHVEQLSPADAIRSLRERLGTVAPPACPPSPAAATVAPNDLFGAEGGRS